MKAIDVLSYFSGEYSAESGQGGTGVGRSTLRVALTRGDLAAKFECHSDNAALEDKPMVTWVEVDVNGKFFLFFFADKVLTP